MASERPEAYATAMCFVLLPRLVFPTLTPIFGDHERAVDEALGYVEVASLLQVCHQDFEHAAARAVTRPLLEAAVAGLVGRESFGQVLPASADA